MTQDLETTATPIPTPDAPKVYTSIKQASGAQGIAYSILRAAKNKGCPGFRNDGRVNWVEVKPWLDTHAEELQADVQEGSKEYWSLERLKYQAKREQFAYEQDKGNFLSKVEVANQLQAIAGATKAVLKSELEDSLPQKLAGLDAIAIRQVMAQTVDSLCRIFEGGFDQWTR